MKRRLCAILLTSIFLVGIMAAAAAAAATTIDVISDAGHATGNVTEDFAVGGGKATITGVYVGEVVTFNVPRPSGATIRATTVSGQGNANATLRSTTASGSGSNASLDVTGVKAGSTTIRLTSGDAQSLDITITIKAAPNTPKFFATGSSAVDLGKIHDPSNDAFASGKEITSTDGSFDVDGVKAFWVSFDIPRGVYRNNEGATSLTATFKPTQSTLTFTAYAISWDKLPESAKSEDRALGMKGYLSGKMPEVNKDTDYVMTVTATDAAGNSKSKEFKFKVLGKPSITASNPSNITWGKDGWKFEPKGTNIDRWEFGVSDDDGKQLLSADGYILSPDQLEKSADIKFDKKTGKFEFVKNKTWKPGRQNNYIFTSTDMPKDGITKKIKLVGFKGNGTEAVSASKEVEVKFVPVAPAYPSGKKIADYEKNLKGTWSVDINSKDATITIEAPGEVTFESGDLPEGLRFVISDDTSDSYTTVIRLVGNPKETTPSKGKKAKLEATNAVGTLKINPTVIIGLGPNGISFDKTIGSNDSIPSGDKRIGESVTDLVLRAYPGPITWTATNLPKGVTLTPDPEDSTRATLSGTFNEARKSDKLSDREYKITATNSDYGKSGTISGDLMVYPELSFKTKEDKAIPIKIGEKADFKIEMNGFPKYASYDITLNGVKMIGSGNASTNAFETQARGVSADALGKSFISLDLAALSKDPTVLSFTGSWDRMPEGEVSLVIKAGDKVGQEATGTFTITPQGVAPKFGSTKDIKLTKDAGWSTDIKLDAGTPSIDMTAKIDASTVKKIFGVDAGEIVLSTALDPTTGLSFDHDSLGKFKFYISSDKHLAYNKLPVTVTAKNERISEKDTTAKLTITVAGNDPKWHVSNDLTGFRTGTGFEKDVDVTNKTAKIVIDASSSTPLSGDGYIAFKVSGDGPLVYSIKPEEKNGITATLDKDAKTVTFGGTPADAKKDVTTKFTLSAKNNSTGKEAKLTVEITAAQKPEIDSKSKEKMSVSGIYGKKLKVAPKLAKTTKKVTWVITEVSSDVTHKYEWDVGAYSAGNDYGKKFLKDNYGLEFDSKKGTINGAMFYATGPDNKVWVKMQASSDLTSSDVVEANFTVTGAKTKLKTKTVELNVGSDTIEKLTPNNTNKVIETDQVVVGSDKKKKSIYQASVDIAGTFEDDAVSNMGFSYVNNNTYKLTGSPSKVTKKVSVPVVMTNYGTETKGKLSIVVNGEKPTANVVGSPNITAGEDEDTAQVKISNEAKVSDKIKWKITKKPAMAGVTAKIKADDSTGLAATLTVKASKKAAGGPTSVTLEATDSVTKLKSDPIEVQISVAAAPTDTNSAIDEVASNIPEATPEIEAKAEEKALGEGTVKIGAERGIGGLSAQQRAFIEDKGYIIAAVLPELEVEEASGPYEFEVDELEEAAATGAELAYFAFASTPTTDDEYVVFSDAEGDSEETKVIPESRKLIAEVWLNVGTKYAPVIAVKADKAEAEATTVEEVKAQAEEKAEEKAAEGEAEDVKPEAVDLEVKEEAAE